MTHFDLEITARTAYAEASDQGWIGILAVVNVINSRAKQRGHTLAEVCLQALQFSCWNALLDGKNNPDRMRMARAEDDDVILVQCRAAVDKTVGSGDILPDPTDGATSYHVVGLTPDWAASMVPTVVIGRHSFYKEAPKYA